ncbi:metal-dependent hydrolase [Geodermatophilus sp. SYSU D00758]
MQRPAVRVLASLAALAAICLLDAALAARRWSVPAEAVIDWSAHLLTAGLLLAAAGFSRGRLVTWALVGAVVVDLDHVPLYLGAEVTAGGGGGRPVTHSVVAVLLLAAVAALWRARRTVVAGLALGVALHIARDVAIGPGVPLFWPLVDDSFRVAWTTYLGLLVVATAAACWRAWRSAGERPPAPCADHPAG